MLPVAVRAAVLSLDSHNGETMLTCCGPSPFANHAQLKHLWMIGEAVIGLAGAQ